MKWIKVSDPYKDLPTKEQFLAIWKGTVSFVVPHDKIEHYYYVTFLHNDEILDTIFIGHNQDRLLKFTHWMPLPQPPKDE